MNLKETARTSRLDKRFIPVLTMPFAHGIAIKTEPSAAPSLLDENTIALAFSSEGVVDILPWNTGKTFANFNVDSIAYQDLVGTSAHFDFNTALRWIAAPARVPSIVDCLRDFYSIDEVTAVGLDDRRGEKPVYVLLSTVDRSDELLNRLIDIEERIQGKLENIFMSFNYLPMAGRKSAPDLPTSISWTKK